MPGIDKHKICAVIVTFHPSQQELNTGVEAIWSQVGQVVLVDNTPAGASEIVANYATLPVMKLILGDNRGVASAQNSGIGWAQRHGYSHVLLLDQDSVPARDMVEKLCLTLDALRRAGRLVAAVGPVLYDGRDGRQVHFAVRRRGRMRRYFCSGNEEVVKVEYLISSGSLLPLDNLANIGLLEDSLFIEYVDVEWCLRARHKGYSCFGVSGAVLSHNLGDTAITSPLLLGRRFQTYAPVRFYYQFRNAVDLCRRRYVPLCVTLHILVVHIFCRLLLSLILLPSRWQLIKMMSRGLWHGITGKTGPMAEG